MINKFGNIFEGTLSADGKMNGFCVLFLGYTQSIKVGWYQNNIPNGNFISLNPKDMQVTESGWYNQGVRVGIKKDHAELKNFTPEDVFAFLKPDWYTRSFEGKICQLDYVFTAHFPEHIPVKEFEMID